MTYFARRKETGYNCVLFVFFSTRRYNTMEERSDHLNIVLLFIIINVLCSENFIYSIAEATRLKVTLPVNPVREGEIVSIHCQVWELQPGQYVTLSRQTDRDSVSMSRQTDRDSVSMSRQTDSHSQMLSWGEDIIGATNDNIFLAVRQMPNHGTFVYFLTLTSVTRDHAGEYSCKVMTLTHSGAETIVWQSVFINIVYFPSQGFPSCSSNLVSYDSSDWTLILNCTSEEAFPAVSMAWSIGGDCRLPPTTPTTNGAITTSVLTLRSRSWTCSNNAVFVCKIISAELGREATCHLGPFPEIKRKHLVPVTAQNSNMANTTDWTVTNRVKNTRPHDLSNISSNCVSICSNNNSRQSTKWIISTTVASALCILMCTFAIASWVICREDKRAREFNMAPSLPSVRNEQLVQGAYAQLEYKRDINKLYMTLNTSEVPVESKITKVDNEHNREVYHGQEPKSRYV